MLGQGRASVDNGPVVFVYQRMLPYHHARFTAVSEALRRQGRACVALEVASFDRSYGQLSDASLNIEKKQCSRVCLFPVADYLDLRPKLVANAVCNALYKLAPSMVFAPAPAFAEGAGAFHYKVRHGGRLVLMDDAWDVTDRRSWLTRCIKKIFYGYVEGGFFPARLHGDYFITLNIPHERQRYCVDVVGSLPEQSLCRVKEVVNVNFEPYVLFVGRLISRKRLDVLLRAIADLTPSVRLVVIGEGPDRDALQTLASGLGLGSRVQWLGRCSNTEARLWMAKAQALLVPSEFEQWGLVVNEAWMAPTLVLGSVTVGALNATYKNELHWMMVAAGDVAGWQNALTRLMALTANERAMLIDESRSLAEKYSLAAHTQSVLELMNLPQRARPIAPAGWLVRVWQGRVAVW